MTEEIRLTCGLAGPVETGTERYYLDRMADFRLRCPHASPPSYYVDYGNKCLRQFVTTKPTLSPRGQRWVEDTMDLLQEMMEEERRGNAQAFAALEHDDDAFRSFAFGTHSRAYHQAGAFDLGLRDLWKIVRTPDLSDVLADDGLREILQLVLGFDAGDGTGLVSSPHVARPGVLAEVSRSVRRLRSQFSRFARTQR